MNICEGQDFPFYNILSVSEINKLIIDPGN